MAYVPANNVLQVELRGLLFGQDVETTQYFARGDTIEEAEVEALFDWYEAVFIPALRPQATGDFAWDEIYATDLTTSTSPTYSRIISPAVVGSQAGAGLPGSNAICISFRTMNRGRSGRGRNYLSGTSEAQCTGNLPSLAQINALVAAYELLLGGGTFPSGWDWVVISRFFEGVARIAALIQQILDVLSTDVTMDSQRGRLR